MNTQTQFSPGHRPAPDGQIDPRWQAIIAVEEYIETDPEEVWSFIARWGVHENEDLRAAVATCLLEHMLEFHFDLVFPRVERLAQEDSNFALTFSMCWKFGQSLLSGNSRRLILRTSWQPVGNVIGGVEGSRFRLESQTYLTNMIIIREYAWFIMIVYWAVHILWRRRLLKPRIDSGELTSTEVTEFQVWSIIAIAIPCGLIGILDVTRGEELPSLTSSNLEDPTVLGSWIVTVICWVLLIQWIWLRSGAEYLAKFAPILGLPSKPRHVRALITVMVLVGIAAAILIVFQPFFT